MSYRPSGRRKSLRTSRATNEYNWNKFQVEQGNANRTHEAGRDDAAATQRVAADKSWADHTALMFQTRDGKGNTVTDNGKVAAYTRAVDHTVGKLAEKLAASQDPRDQAKARTLAKHGRAAMDDQDRAMMAQLFERQQLHAATAGGLNPLTSGGMSSQNLMDFHIVGKTDGFQNRAKTSGGQTIPVANLKHGADANLLFPNLGAGSNYLLN